MNQAGNNPGSNTPTHPLDRLVHTATQAIQQFLPQPLPPMPIDASPPFARMGGIRGIARKLGRESGDKLRDAAQEATGSVQLEGGEENQEKAASKRSEGAQTKSAASDAVRPLSERKINPWQESAKQSREYLQYDSMRIVNIAPDGRCFFRALAQGMARHQGRNLSGKQEVDDADQLRMAVHDALCRDESHAQGFKNALNDIEVHEKEPLQSYCRRLAQPGFWGGNPEIMVLSKLLSVPVYVYGQGTQYGGGTPHYVNLAKYGEEHSRPTITGKGRRPVRLLYQDGNHFDLMVFKR